MPQEEWIPLIGFLGLKYIMVRLTSLLCRLPRLICPEYVGSYDPDAAKWGNVLGGPGSFMQSSAMPLTVVEGAYTLKEYLKVPSNGRVMWYELSR